MTKLPRSLFLAACAALSACAPGQVASWPDVNAQPAGSRQGVLLKMTFDDTFNGYFVFDHEVFFLRPDDPPSDGMSVPLHHSQTYSPGRYDLDRFPSDLVLVPLRPGHYDGIDVALWYVPTARGVASQNIRVQAPPSLGTFDVVPGKLTVLGTMRVTAHLGGAFAATSTGLASPDEKLEVIDEALSRPEAESRGWANLLQLAKAELAKR